MKRLTFLPILILVCLLFLQFPPCFSNGGKITIHNQRPSINHPHSIVSIRGGKTKPVKRSFFSKIMKSIRNLLSYIIPTKQKGRYSIQEKGSKPEKKTKTAKSSSSSGVLGRLQREMESFLKNPPQHLELQVDPKNIRSWVVSITGAEGTVFAGEKYKLKMEFSKDYPTKPPAVYFLKPVPRHVHVYSNGDICLNFLGRDWRPMMTAESLAISILSMLSSAKEKSLPQDNAMHADNAPGQQQDNWMYHDDRC